MSPFWIGFLLGLGVGAVVGMVVISACVAASRADRRIEAMRKRDATVAGHIAEDESLEYGHRLRELRRVHDDEQAHNVTDGRSW